MKRIVANDRYIHVGGYRFLRETFEKGKRQETERYVRHIIQRCMREPMYKVADELGVQVYMLARMVEAAGLRKCPTHKGPRGTAWRKQEVERLYWLGVGDTEVAKHIGVSRQSAYRLRCELGLGGIKPKPPAANEQGSGGTLKEEAHTTPA